MTTIREVVERLLPRGPSGDGNFDWSRPPLWPPDVFAIAATLVRLTEAYAHPSVRGGLGLDGHRANTVRVGRRWAGDIADPRVSRWVRLNWARLLASGSTVLTRLPTGTPLPNWMTSVLRLFAASDEASVGLGFGGPSDISRAGEQIALRNTFVTWCRAVDPSEAVVQPKGRTPAVGCNLRSMSLHLALLPQKNLVQTQHLPRLVAPKHNPLGILLVPFPYRIEDNDFFGQVVPAQSWGRLNARFTWAAVPNPTDLAEFVGGLIDSAGGPVDTVIFPEVALSFAQLRAVQKAAIERGVRMLLGGVHDPGNPGRNIAVGSFTPFDEVNEWRQSKHHRWRVDRHQVENYGLELNPAYSWWEDIDVGERAVVAARFSEGATVACLVCEDLARVEPVQPALREMGASLIVALLMDGPQYEQRWAAKSATVFADDPGSSVLAFTSLALVRRAQARRYRHKRTACPPIAVWQEPGTGALEVPIEPDAHAVYFRVRVVEQEEHTLDGRSDGGAAEVVRLSPGGAESFSSVRHPAPPTWAVPMYRT